MENVQQAAVTRQFTVSTEIFEVPDLTIYEQMVCIVLRAYSNSSVLPTVVDIAEHGRMSVKQASDALKYLVDKKILPHRVFKEIVGEFGDDRLSWTAKGLLLYLSNNPRAKFIDLLELVEQSNDDDDRVRIGLQELKQYGYLDEISDLAREIAG